MKRLLLLAIALCLPLCGQNANSADIQVHPLYQPMPFRDIPHESEPQPALLRVFISARSENITGYDILINFRDLDTKKTFKFTDYCRRNMEGVTTVCQYPVTRNAVILQLKVDPIGKVGETWNREAGQ